MFAIYEQRMIMVEIIKGHEFDLKTKKGNIQKLLFYSDPKHGSETDGVTNQEVLLALISRIKFLDSEVSCEENTEILYHLRMALILHETRHMKQLVNKSLPIEMINNFEGSPHMIPSDDQLKGMM